MDFAAASPPPPEEVAKAALTLRQTATAIFAALEAVGSNAVAAREAVARRADDVLGIGLDADVVGSSLDALLCEIDRAESRKVNALEAESVVVDAALELVIRAGEGGWPVMTAEDADRAIAYIQEQPGGPHEPTTLYFVSAEPLTTCLGRIVAPSAVGVDGVTVTPRPFVWRGITAAVAVVALDEALTTGMTSTEMDDALGTLALRLRASVTLAPAGAGGATKSGRADGRGSVAAVEEPLPVSFVPCLEGRSVEVRVAVPERDGERGRGGGASSSAVIIQRLSLGENSLLQPGAAGTMRVPVCADLRAPLLLRGAAAGLVPGCLMACSSLAAGRLFIGGRRDGAGTATEAVTVGAADVLRAFESDGSPAFELSPADHPGLPPTILAAAFDDITGTLILALCAGHTGDGLAGDALGLGSNAVAAFDAATLVLRWTSPASARVSSLAALGDEGLVVAAEGAHVVVRRASDGTPVPSAAPPRGATLFTGAHLVADPSRARILAFVPPSETYMVLRWEGGRGAREEGAGRFTLGRSLPLPRGCASAWRSFAVVPPPALLQATLGPPDAARPPPLHQLIYPVDSDPTGASFEVRTLPGLALVMRHTFAAPVAGLATTASGTSLVIADALGDVHVLKWPLQGAVASASTLGASVMQSALARRRAAAEAAVAAAAGATASAMPMVAEVAAQPAPVRGIADSSSLRCGHGASEPLPPPSEGPWPSLAAKYGRWPAYCRFAAVEAADYEVRALHGLYFCGQVDKVGPRNHAFRCQQELFGSSKEVFDALPRWRREALRKKAGMF